MKRKLIRLSSLMEYREYPYQIIPWNKDCELDLIVYYKLDKNADLEYIPSSDLAIKGIEIKHSGKRLKYLSSKNYDNLQYLIDKYFDWDSIIESVTNKKECLDLSF